jgi:hypothetical protein
VVCKEGRRRPSEKSIESALCFQKERRRKFKKKREEEK